MSTEPMYQDENLTRTYSGVLDDVMIRYGKGREFLSAEFFNRMILKNVIFGSGMYLNDGYLVNHPMARAALADENSLLRCMISTGFIRILSREPDPDRLAAMPEHMAASGNAQFQQLVASDEWQRLRPAYRAVSHAVFHDNTVRSWPAYDMSSGFYDLMERVWEARDRPANLGLRLTGESAFKAIEENFRRRDPRRGNARDALEKAAREENEAIGTDVDERMAEIMEIGNQAYHYNFGLTLNAEEKAPVAADTTLGMAFDELLKSRKIERAQLDAIPLLNFPKEIPFDDGELFLPFIRSDTDLSKAKRAYLGALNRLIEENARDIPTLTREAQEATQVYMERMRAYFAPRYGKTDVDIIFGTATFGSGSDGGSNVAAPTAHLAVALQRASNKERRAFLVERFELKDVTSEFNANDGEAFTIGDIRFQLASLAFDEQEAAKFVEGIPRFDTK